MRIALIGQKGLPAHSGGVERHVDYLATRLVQDGHDVSVYCRKSYSLNPNIPGVYRGVRLITIPTIPSKHLETPIQTLLASIHVLFQDVDLIHYHGIGPALFLWIPRLFKPKARVIATFHCQDYYQQKWNALARFAFRIGEWFACKVSHRTIVVSRHLLRYVKERYGRDAVYIPNAVPLPERKHVRNIRSFGLDTGSYILCVSRLIRHKGIHTIIEAYNRTFGNSRRALKLVIVGASAHTDDYVKELKDLAAGNPNILLVGEQNQEVLAELYSNTKLFIQASESEGLSYALLEALSYGAQVLVSDITENKEVLPAVGRTFRVNDIEDLIRAMREMTREDHVPYSIVGRLHIQKEYNLDTAIEDILTFYRGETSIT